MPTTVLLVDEACESSQTGRWRLAVRCAAGTAGLIGIIGLVGWIADLPQLRSILPGAVEMKLNTAIALVLASASVTITSCRTRGACSIAAQALGLVVGLIGLLTIAEYVWEVPLGIDEALIADHAHAFNAIPGRMSPYSAVAFFALGTALVALPRRRLRWLAAGAALAATLIGAISVLGYLWNAEELTTDEWLPPVAIHTGVALALLGMATIAAGYDVRMRIRASAAAPIRPVTHKIFAGFLVSIVLFCIGGGMTYRMAVEAIDAEGLLVHTKDVQVCLEQLYGATMAAASEQRGYVATGLAQYKSAFHRTREQLPQLLDNLQALVADNPQQLQRARSLATSVRKHARDMALLVDEFDQTGGAASRPDNAGEEVESLASISTQLREMANVEQNLVTVRSAALTRQRGYTLVMLLCTLVVGSATLIILFESILRDMRYRARIQKALQEATQEAQRATNAKSEFLATMSHEIRTPINGIIGMLELLQQSSLRGQQIELARVAGDSADALLHIVSQILDFSKIEAGRLEIESAPFCLADLVENTCGLLNRVADRKGVALTLFCDPRIPRQLSGDAGRVRQIVINLVNNAIKFCSGLDRSGQVSVRVLASAVGAEQAEVVLTVQDNGIGIDAAARARLFKAFVQADASTTRRYGGTGLGLAICDQLVTLMGGTIQLESEPDQFTRFSIRLPFKVPALAPEADAAARPLSDITCVVIGQESGLAPDLAAYLDADGATVARAQDVAAAAECSGRFSAGTLIWVLDAGNAAFGIDELQRVADLRISACPRAVVIVVGGGAQRGPRAQADGMTVVDGNALKRRELAEAVANAANRAPRSMPIATHRASTPVRVLARDEAIHLGRLILVAEDNEINQQVIVRQLAVLGYAAEVASDGQQALEMLANGNYALLLTDLHMPGVDGYDLALKIRMGSGRNAKLPIVALTANALKGEAERCLTLGMNDYVTKPIKLGDLQAVLDKWLHKAAPEETAAVRPGQALDSKVLESLVGNDPQVIRSLLNDFAESAESLVGQLVGAWNARALPEASAISHKLKSSARSVGALRLGDLCARLEDAAAEGADALPQLVGELLAECERVIVQIRGETAVLPTTAVALGSR